MKFTFLVYSILFILIFSIVSFSCSSKRKKEAEANQKMAGTRPPAPRVDGYVVTTQTISENLEIPGTIVSEDATEIHPEVAGRIISLNVREGSYIGKGAVLAKLNDADLQAQKRKLQVQLQIAQQTQNRHEELLKIGGISKDDYTTTALQVSNLRADLDIINTEIAKTVIRAPFSGKLGFKDISSGAYVTPASIIATIQKTNDLKLDFNLPEKYTSQIRKGQFVNFTIEGSKRSYTAVINATESGIEQTTRSMMIRAQVTGDATGLVPGNFAKVKLNFEPDPNAILIPSQAIIPQARGKKVVVFNGGKANFVDVTTGIRDSSMIQITSGLNSGDTIVITGLLSVKPDATISIGKIVNKKG
ncbi:MAG: efflux RND transporter periplasmic adaptor subunit [Flavisolibacter sp.]